MSIEVVKLFASYFFTLLSCVCSEGCLFRLNDGGSSFCFTIYCAPQLTAASSYPMERMDQLRWNFSSLKLVIVQLSKCFKESVNGYVVWIHHLMLPCWIFIKGARFSSWFFCLHADRYNYMFCMDVAYVIIMFFMWPSVVHTDWRCETRCYIVIFCFNLSSFASRSIMGMR